MIGVTMTRQTNKEALQSIIDSLTPIMESIDKHNEYYTRLYLDINYDLEKVIEELKRLKDSKIYQIGRISLSKRCDSYLSTKRELEDKGYKVTYEGKGGITLEVKAEITDDLYIDKEGL